MIRDWDGIPIDTGPPLREPAWPHRKKAPIKKPWAIEYRYVGSINFPFQRERAGKWRVWKRYKTEKSRDQALEVLNKKTWLRGKFYDYRKKE